jgi:hypothetical protein
MIKVLKESSVIVKKIKINSKPNSTVESEANGIE